MPDSPADEPTFLGLRWLNEGQAMVYLGIPTIKLWKKARRRQEIPEPDECRADIEFWHLSTLENCRKNKTPDPAQQAAGARERFMRIAQSD